MAAVRIASVDRQRPEGLVPMWLLISTMALLLRLINGGRILDSDVILTTFAIVQLDLTLDVE